MSAAKVFDAPIKGLKRIGTLAVPKSADVPESSNASIGFESLDRGLFDPDRCYDALAAAGVKWARVQTMWSRCEKQKGVYDFTVLDSVVDNMLRRGIRPWFCVSFGNTLYMTNCYTGAAVGCVPTLYGDECRAAWCAYVRELAKRYRGKVTHWEIWNEPNIREFWQPSNPNANEYIELVKLTGGVIREEIPDAKIGGVTSSPALNGWERKFFEMGGAKAIDFWSGHAYGCVPERLRHAQKVATESTDDYVAVLNDMRAFIDAKGGKHVEIWQGEAGFPSWFPESHWLYPRGVCKAGWQSQANQAKWMLRRFVTDRRAGIARSSFYQMADISRHYSMSNITRKHPAEHGILNGWTYQPKMSYHAFGNYNALLATAKYDASVGTSVSPSSDGGVPTVSAAFRTANGSPIFLYYTAFDFSGNYTGTCYTARCDAELTVPAKIAPQNPVLVDMLRGGVYEVSSRIEVNGTVTFAGLPLVDYPLVLADLRCVKFADSVAFTPERSFRGVWVATVYDPRFSEDLSKKSVDGMKAYWRSILDAAERVNVNAVFFQVRACADAFYKSELEPWSLDLRGEQGKAPEGGFDPLQFMIDECHARGMQLHAWFNPFRVTYNDGDEKKLAKTHNYFKHPDWFVKYGKSVYYDPGVPACREWTAKVVMDVATRYDIDGIHIDDYFYPYDIKDSKGRTIPFPDEKSFRQYGGGFKSIDAWRDDNSDKLVADIARRLRELKPDVVFGVAPFNNNDYCVRHLHCDTLKWAKNGWIDYMIPQLYYGEKCRRWTFWWDSKAEDCAFFAGRFLKNLNQKVEYGPRKGMSEFDNMVETHSQMTNLSGVCWWSAQRLMQNTSNVTDRIAAQYPRKTLVPLYRDRSSTPPPSVVDVRFERRDGHVTLHWRHPDDDASHKAVFTAIFRGDDRNPVALVQGTSFDAGPSSEDVWRLVALDRLQNAAVAVVTRNF